MKSTALIAALLFSSFASADGTLADQAAEALESAAQMFETTQGAETVKMLQTVTVTNKGHEKFDVLFTTSKDSSTSYPYSCQENEAVEPATWVCVPL